MSAKKVPTWLPPVAFVGLLALALVLSNGTPEMPGGGKSIATVAEYQKARAEIEETALPLVRKLDAGQILAPAELGRLRESGKLIDRMNAYDPVVSWHFFLSGKIHFALNEDSIAEEDFLQCVLLAPNEMTAKPAQADAIKLTAAEASYQLSLLLLVRRDVPGALKAADTAVQTVPQSSNYLTSRGSALNELRRVDEAKKDLEAALKIDPNNARAKSLLRFISK